MFIEKNSKGCRYAFLTSAQGCMKGSQGWGDLRVGCTHTSGGALLHTCALHATNSSFQQLETDSSTQLQWVIGTLKNGSFFFFNLMYLITGLHRWCSGKECSWPIQEMWTRETRVSSLPQEDPLEKEMATLSSILTWRILFIASLAFFFFLFTVSGLNCTAPPHTHTHSYVETLTSSTLAFGSWAFKEVIKVKWKC